MAEDRDIGGEAVEVANAINNACAGYHRASVLIGISMVLGYSESLTERPNLPALMKLIEKGAEEEFARRRPDPSARPLAPTQEMGCLGPGAAPSMQGA